VTGTSPMVAAQLARKRLVRGLGGKERGVEGNVNGNAGCRINCGSSCEELTCCG